MRQHAKSDSLACQFRRWRSNRGIALLAIAAFAGPLLGSQATESAQTPETQTSPLTVFKSEAREVSVVFRVVDKNNQPVAGITPAEIHIEDEGISRNATSFRANVAHAQVVVLADVSGSMATVLEPLQGALATFADLVSKDIDREPGDVLLSLVPFSDTASILIDRTPNPADFKEAVTRLRPSGSTALVDTVLGTLLNAFADKDLSLPRKGPDAAGQDTSPIPSEFRPKRQGAKIGGAKRSKFLVLFTDAGENASSHKWSDIASSMLGKEVTIYSIAFDSGTPDANLSMLSNITVQSGGKVYQAKVNDLERVYSQIARDIRSHYQLTFSASDVENARRWRTIRLTTSRPGVTIFARSGYCPETPCQKTDGTFVGAPPKTWSDVLAINRDPGLIFSVREHLRDLKFQYTAETERIVRDLGAGPLLIERVWSARGKHSGSPDKPTFVRHAARNGNEYVNIDAEVCGITLDSETRTPPQANVGADPFLLSPREQALRVVNPEIRLARRPGALQQEDAARTGEAYFQSQAVFSLRDPSGRIPSRIRVQCNRPHFLIGEDLVKFAADALEQGLNVRTLNAPSEESRKGTL
jgi:VWFA-related protein